MKIYEPSGRAREYSPLALNFFKGCTHDCAYCYVNSLNSRFGNGVVQSRVKPPSDFGFAELERSAKAMEGCGKQILLSFTGDPYCDTDPDYTRKVLQILNRYKHKVAILTKGGMRVLNDLDIFKKFEDRIKVGATFTFDNVKDSLEWEPGAAIPQDRIDSLAILANHGIKTWGSFEPVIYPNQSLNLLNSVAGFIDHIKIGKINNYKGIDKKINWEQFINDSVNICRNKNVKFYIKNDLSTFNRSTFLNPEERQADFLSL